MNRLPVRRSEIGREVRFFGKPYIWVDGSAGLCLVRRPGWWDEDLELDQCSITSHCFVSNRHTGELGCRRPPTIPLPPAELPWGC